MKFNVKKLPEAQKELDDLDETYRNNVESDYEIIEKDGREFVITKPLRDGLYEIVSGRVRSIFTYEANQQIIISVVFLKKTQKTPDKHIRSAKRRLHNYYSQN